MFINLFYLDLKKSTTEERRKRKRRKKKKGDVSLLNRVLVILIHSSLNFPLFHISLAITPPIFFYCKSF